MIIRLSNMKILKLIWIRYLSVSDFIRKNTLPHKFMYKKYIQGEE
jgi:hypothetical protein